MSTAVIVIVIVGAVLAGTILSLRKSTRTGMPPKDVLDRATRRARELEQQEKDE
jgi:hypothetical protein